VPFDKSEVRAAFRAAWDESESFRSSVEALLALPPERLRALLPNGPDMLEGPLKNQTEADALSVVAWMIGWVDASAPKGALSGLLGELVAEKAPTLQSAFEQLRPELDRILFRSPDEELALLVENAEHAILPTLQSLSTAIDLRLVELPSAQSPGSGAIDFIPVVQVRFTFDEVVGGNRSIAFQLPSTVLEELGVELARLSDSLQQLNVRFGNRFPKHGSQ
jgi:hypothetical protein